MAVLEDGGTYKESYIYNQEKTYSGLGGNGGGGGGVNGGRYLGDRNDCSIAVRGF